MKEQFATFKIALALKELGFDEPFVFFGNTTYFINGRISSVNTGYYELFNEDKEFVFCPLWQQAIDWVFKKLDFYYPYMRIEYYSDGSGIWYHPADDGYDSLTIDFDNKEECILKAIELIKDK